MTSAISKKSDIYRTIDLKKMYYCIRKIRSCPIILQIFSTDVSTFYEEKKSSMTLYDVTGLRHQVISHQVISVIASTPHTNTTKLSLSEYFYTKEKY